VEGGRACVARGNRGHVSVHRGCIRRGQEIVPDTRQVKVVSGLSTAFIIWKRGYYALFEKESTTPEAWT